MKLPIGRAPEPREMPGDDAAGAVSRPPTIVLVSGACCFPPLRALDAEARRVITSAIDSSGVSARVVEMSSSQAYYGGLPRELAEAGRKRRDEVGIAMFPTVLVDLEVVSYGVPTVDVMVGALERVGDVR